MRHKGKKVATSMNTNNLEQWTIDSLGICAGKQNEIDQKLYLITNNTVTIPPFHMSVTPLKCIKHVMNNKFKPKTLIEIE